jgi:two-component system, chemotaxis family, sensor kinase CheA
VTDRDSSADDFVAGFLDDYFAECEEHLAILRRALLELGTPADPRTEAGVLDELFRSYHSLKGISAMVDVREAERLAHELEAYLRRLRDGDLTLGPDAVSVLIDSTAVLETVIAARRAGAPPPSIAETVRRLAALTSSNATANGTAPGSRARSGPPNWRFTFVPSPALVDRGVKVDTIRARLGEIGRIGSVAPHVTPGGGIVFEFLVATTADAESFERWAKDGLTWEPVEASSTPAADGASGHTSGPGSSDTAILAPSHYVRVDLGRLDEVMRRVGDLVVMRARLDETFARVERAIPSAERRTLQESMLTFERHLRDLRRDVMRLRLVRVDEIFRRMPFVARDVARDVGKTVRVVLSGQETEIDKFLVERMMDPILHLVRNAVSHGIETARDRVAAGKSVEGTITLSASTYGEMVVLQIADDGAGIDTQAVAERARAADARLPHGPIESAALLDLICEPGFSTRDEADRASGRGIGMSVVRTTVRELGGTMTLATEHGRGTTFRISLPLTLAITEALIASAGRHRFAVPQSAIEEVIEIDETLVRRTEHLELVPYRGRSLPLVRLSTLFALDSEAAPRRHAFVVGTGQDAVALVVDRILGQRQVVVRTMRDALLKVDGISGATDLGDGRVVLILDAATLARGARAARSSGSAPRAGGTAAGHTSNGAMA